MAKTRTRLSVDLTPKQIDLILRTFGASELIEMFMRDSRVVDVYVNLNALYYQPYPRNMPQVDMNVKNSFFKSFDAFCRRLEPLLKRSFAEFALEQFAATGNIHITRRQVTEKASEHFSQLLHVIYEETASNIKLNKVLNGQQTIRWL